jgi:hypothetical protein
VTTALSSAIDALASEFAWKVVEAIRASSLAEILTEVPGAAPRPGRPPKLAARTASSTSEWTAKATPTSGSRSPKQDTGQTVELIVAYLRSHPGITGEGARKALGLEKNRWNTCVARAIKDGKVRKEGERRSTRYWAT